MKNTQLYPQLLKEIEGLNIDSISEERKAILNSLREFIKTKLDLGENINVNFICTHNSRRSHLSQIWAQVFASYFHIRNFYSYSGGTEATALFPAVTNTLENQGFKIHKLTEENNPVYAIKYGENEHPIIGFSKTFDHDFNPESGFAAVMTCSQADEGCPFIAGAEKRIPITYNDPKEFDGTPQQLEMYKERSVQIATELFYVFSNIN